jgi:ligand-binding sensor domain-containing protein/signal transduction histidine kinase
MVLGLALALSAAELSGAGRTFQTFSSANGLASDSVTALRVDPRGYLWIGTVDGLSRFDGERFVRFGPESGLPSPRIADVEVVRGRLYVATAKGLAWLDESRSDRRPFVAVSLPGVAAGDLDTLYADRQGRLWAGGPGGLFKFDAGSSTARRIDLSREERTSVRSIVEDGSGTVWVGTADGLVRLAPGLSPEWRPVAAAAGHDSVNALAVDEAGRLWIGHDRGLFLVWPPRPGEGLAVGAIGARAEPGVGPDGRPAFPSVPGEVRKFDIPGTPLRQLSLAGGRSLVATSFAVTEIAPGSVGEVVSVTDVTSDNVSALETDRDGNVWIGTEGHGLLRLRRDGVTTFGPGDGLADKRIRSLVALPGGPIVALGTRPSLLSILRNGAFHGIHLKVPDVGYQGWGWGQVALLDRSGAWWMASGTGLRRFGRTRFPEGLGGAGPERTFTAADGLGAADIFRIFEDSRGDIWVGSFGEPVLTRWDARAGKMEAICEPALPRHTPSAFAEDRAGNLWVAFYGHGLGRLRRGRWTVFAPGELVPDGFVHALLPGRDGSLWVGTGRDGLWRTDEADADSPRFARQGGEELPSQSIRALVEDGESKIWIGSTRGIARLDPSTGRLRLFGQSQGLPNEIVTCAVRDDGGLLWFGTLDGLVRIEPGADPAARPPVALVTSVSIDGAPRFLSPLGRAEGPDLELPPEWRRLSVEFVAPSLSPETSPRFETRLTGAETVFGPSSDARRADFTGLSPGKYRFEVRAVRGWAAGPVASFGFVVPVPFWRRPWVVGSLALAAAGAFYAAHRVRVAHLLSLERVRTGIATDLHDDLGSSLSRISLLAEVVRREAEGSPRAQRLAVEIGEGARRMGAALSDNIWSVDPRYDDLRSIADRISVFAADLLEARGVEWRMDLPEEVAGQAVPPAVRRHLLLCLKEAANNAAKHSAARHVGVRFRRDGRSLLVTVSDDGRGIGSSSPEPGSGRGLPGMRRRAEEMGGTFEFASAPGEGTVVTLSVPLPRSA